MKVLITGGAGFIGRRLVDALLARGSASGANGSASIDEIVVADIGPPLQPFPDDARIRAVYGDFSGADAIEALLDEDVGLVFHLAAVVSGEAEQNFDLGLRVNLQGTMNLLERARALPSTPRLVFASSVAAYGGDMPEVIDDRTILSPQTSYGSQKAVAELLVHDYSRKGFLDGRALRLPTVVVRPGKANAAASSFASAIIREPLEGREYVCPVKRETGVWLLSPRRVVAALVHASDLAADAFGASRAVALPGMTVTVGEMVDALAEVAGARVADRLHFEADPFIEEIVYGWATRFAPRRGLDMGFEADTDFRSIVEAFIEDDLGGRFVE